MSLTNLEISKAKFDGDFRVLEQRDLELLGLSRASLLSEASTLVPKEFDSEKNIDILPVVFNVAVVNKFNANHDGIDTESAANILKQFIHKPINIEHIKTYIVGHIVNASFSDKQPDFEEQDIDKFKGRTSPFYITLAGFIYKNIYPELAEALIHNSDPESEYYKMFASSWEISFSDYRIAIGSELLENCEVLNKKEHSESFVKYIDVLKSKGGSGFSDKGQVSRLLGGEMYPLGCAFAENPAAEVSGVYTLASLVDEEYSKKNSLSNKNNKDLGVTNSDEENSEFMTDEQFKQFMEAITSAKAGESQASKDIAEKFEAVLSAQGEWKSKAEKAEEKLTQLEAKAKESADELSKANEKLTQLESDLKVKEDSDRYNSRMSTISEAYELSEAEEKIVADEVRSVGDADSDFKAYLDKVSVVFAHRNKEAIASQKEGEGEKEIETKEDSNASVINNNGEHTEEKSLIESLRESGLETE